MHRGTIVLFPTVAAVFCHFEEKPRAVVRVLVSPQVKVGRVTSLKDLGCNWLEWVVVDDDVSYFLKLQQQIVMRTMVGPHVRPDGTDEGTGLGQDDGDAGVC